MPAAEQRKSVTIVFCDLTGSTAMGEQLDPESLRHVLQRYYTRMQEIVNRHGGTVEKFIGDAVMAVFGIPAVHEDDALRAARAACEMRDAVDELNRGLEDDWGAAIAVRIGVNTGEVVASAAAGDGDGFVVGDPVNTAARLEQAAEPGEVIVGDATYRLIRDAASVEAIPPLTLKGKAQPVTAWRLVSVAALAPGIARRLETPLVGRRHELELLEQAVARAIGESTCHLVTILAPAGTGKSRLTHELLHIIGDRALVVSGRCVPYGEGITYWPIAEILRSLAGIGLETASDEARRRLDELVPESEEAPLIRDRLAAVFGLVPPSPNPEETFWALRKLVEALAGTRPLALIIDDIHWAEPTLLDLIEYLVGWTQSVPVIIVCPARPELLEARPAWTAPRPEATSIVLQPLPEGDSRALVRNLLGAAVSPEAERRVVEAAEGNPLFLEELVRILVEDGHLERVGDAWRARATVADFAIPPTIEALLAARLDRLSPGERSVLERASVIGREFWWSAVSAMTPPEDRTAVAGRLQALVRRGFIAPTRSGLPGEDAFRFGHILMRDATYRGMGKESRAGQHEIFADWLAAKAGDRLPEYQEILGFHLEQAYLLLKRLAPIDDHCRNLGRRASAHLAAAGRRAFARGDMSAAAGLLRRASEVLPKRDPERLALLGELGESLMELGQFGDAAAALDEGIALSTEAGDEVTTERLRLVRLAVQLYSPPDDGMDWTRVVEQEVERALGLFGRHGDAAGLALAWRLRYGLRGAACQFGDAAAAALQVIEHATRASEPRVATRGAAGYAVSALYGPTPVMEAIERCEQLIGQVAGDRRTEAVIKATLAQLKAMSGDIPAARTALEEARGILMELGGVLSAATSTEAARIELLAGDRDAAEVALRADYETLTEMGDRFLAASVAGMLAHVVYERGDLDEASALADVVRRLAAEHDIDAQAAWRSVSALVAARRSNSEDARRLAEEAVALRRATDSPTLLAGALTDFADVLELLGDDDGARHPRDEALRLYEAKGDVLSAAALRAPSRADRARAPACGRPATSL